MENSAEVKKLHDWIEAHQNEMVEALQGVLRIPSLEAEGEHNAPFGLKVREALDYTLTLCEKMGFRARDFEGYAGDAEFGAGEEYIGVLGHLDVVPEGEGWTDPPYSAVIKDGYIYARGSADDKGPTYAALFAAKALMESGLPLKRRVRLIFGCNEESGFQCVHHYFETAKEERPLYAFTPDAGFPLIYAEKGIANLVLEKAVPANPDAVHILKARGGLRPNMVPEYAEATLAGSQEALAAIAGELDKHWDRNIAFHTDHDTLTVTAAGKSAHGSRPTNGDNAIVRLARALVALGIAEADIWLQWILDSGDPGGSGLGIAHRDEVAGPLTSNLGILEYAAGGRARLTYNIRYPVTWSAVELLSAGSPVWEKAGWQTAECHDQPPLYVPLDQEPVATLLRVYREETGDEISQPGTMGGGTYARATPRAVAYGAGFPGGADGPAHEPDERIAIDTLVRAAKVFAHALYELAK